MVACLASFSEKEQFQWTFLFLLLMIAHALDEAAVSASFRQPSHDAGSVIRATMPECGPSSCARTTGEAITPLDKSGTRRDRLRLGMDGTLERASKSDGSINRSEVEMGGVKGCG